MSINYIHQCSIFFHAIILAFSPLGTSLYRILPTWLHIICTRNNKRKLWCVLKKLIYLHLHVLDTWMGTDGMKCKTANVAGVLSWNIFFSVRWLFLIKFVAPVVCNPCLLFSQFWLSEIFKCNVCLLRNKECNCNFAHCFPK